MSCRLCLYKKINEGCEVFVDRDNPIRDEMGRCKGKISSEEEMRALKATLAKYQRHHT